MKIAIFKRLGEHSFESVCNEEFEDISSYVRLTEYVDVDFPPLSDESVIQKQVSALDRAEQALRETFQSNLNAIKEERAKLLSLSFVPAE